MKLTIEPTLDPISFGPLGSIVLNLPAQKRRNSQDGEVPRVRRHQSPMTAASRECSFRKLAPSKRGLPRGPSLTKIDAMLLATPSSSRNCSPSPQRTKHLQYSDPDLHNSANNNSAPRITALKEEMKSNQKLRRNSSSSCRRRRSKSQTGPKTKSENDPSQSNINPNDYIVIKRKRAKSTSDKKSRKGDDCKPTSHHYHHRQPRHDSSSSSFDKSPQRKRRMLRAQQANSIRDMIGSVNKAEQKVTEAREEEIHFVRHHSRRRSSNKCEKSADTHTSTNKRRSSSSSNNTTNKITSNARSKKEKKRMHVDEKHKHRYASEKRSLENFLQRKRDLIKKLEEQGDGDGDTWMVSIQLSRGVSVEEDDDVISLTVEDLYDDFFDQEADEGDISIACSHMIN